MNKPKMTIYDYIWQISFLLGILIFIAIGICYAAFVNFIIIKD